MNYKRIQKIEADYSAKKPSQFTLKPFAFAIDNGKDMLQGLVCRPASGYSSYYYGSPTPKDKIALHFTAGHLRGDLSVLTRANKEVSVAFVIARDGTIYQLHHAKHWAYHLGRSAIGGNTTQSKKTIGIELSNYGPLVERDGKMETAYSRPKSNPTILDVYCDAKETDKYVQLSKPYRGQSYFATYTDAQYKQLIVLIKYLSSTYDIPIQFLPLAERYEQTELVANFSGIVSHVNFRKDKTDIGPAFDWDKLINGVTNPNSSTTDNTQKLAKAQKAFDAVEKEVQRIQVKIWDSPDELEVDVAALLAEEAKLERAHDWILSIERNGGATITIDSTASDVTIPSDAYTSEDAILADFPYLKSRGMTNNYGEDGPEEEVYDPLMYES